MATIDSTRILLYNTFIAGWEDTTPAIYDNEDEQANKAAWVRMVVRNQVGNQDSFGREGNRKFLKKGIVLIQVFTPPAEGTSEADLLVEKAKDIFEGKRFGDVWFQAADVRELGVNGAWFQMSVEIPFTSEQIK